MIILGIDPGPVDSAYAILNKELRPIQFAKIPNDELIALIDEHAKACECVAIENVESFGMAVGKEVFQTCVWIGRFTERVLMAGGNFKYVYRKEVKSNLCHSLKAKDSNIRQALIDRFGPVGVKANKGWFYGVSKDVWSAIAVGTTYHDLYLKNKRGE